MKTSRIDEFVAFLNESNLVVLPPTLVVWRGDECLEPLDVTLPELVQAALSPKETIDLQAQTMRDVLRRAGATAMLHAQRLMRHCTRDRNRKPYPIVCVLYEEGTYIEYRAYPITEGPGGVIQLTTFETGENPKGPLVGLLPCNE